MNNIVCPNCGSVNNGGAQYCVKCGTSLVDNQNSGVAQSSGPTGHLTIERKDSFWGIAVSLTVSIGNNSYQLPNGGKLDFELIPGTYPVSYKVWCRSLKTVNVVITPMCQNRIYFTPDLLLGGFKIKEKESKLQ